MDATCITWRGRASRRRRTDRVAQPKRLNAQLTRAWITFVAPEFHAHNESVIRERTTP